MAEIKSAAMIAEKYTRVTPQRSEDYKNGVASPRRDWARSAVAAAPNYKAGVTDAANKGLYEKGVNRAGSAKWQTKAMEKGPGRFAEGVMSAGADYAKGFAKSRDIIEKTVLPPRFPKGDPRNLVRVQAMSIALRQGKVGA